MRKPTFILLTTVALVTAAGAVSTSATAATVEQVVASCDQMNNAKSGSCTYKTYEKSVKGLSGCAGNVCFDCPADGKRLCFAVPGKGGKVGTTQLPSP